MDIWVLLVYGLFLVAIVAGWVSCWRSPLPVAQKWVWSAIILVFPLAGTLIYWLAAEDLKESFK